MPGSDLLPADELVKIRTRAALSILRPPANLEVDCSYNKLLAFLKELREYLANASLFYETRPELIRPWLPQLARDLVDARVGLSPTWAEMEKALKQYCGYTALDLDSVRDALDRCVRRTSWPAGRYRTELESIARDLKGGEEARNIILKDAFIAGQTDAGLKAFLIKHRKEDLDELVKKTLEYEATTRPLGRAGLQTTTTVISTRSSAQPAVRTHRSHSAGVALALAEDDYEDVAYAGEDAGDLVYETCAAYEDTQEDNDDGDINMIEGGTYDHPFELTVVHPTSNAKITLKASCSLSQVNNYILSDCVKRLGLTPIPMDRPRTVEILTLSFPNHSLRGAPATDRRTKDWISSTHLGSTCAPLLISFIG